jgi:hypothetical protein
MLRQVGIAIGVAVLIAVLGSPHSPTEVLAAYQHGWLVIAAIAFAGGVAGFLLLVRRSPAPSIASEPAAVPATGLVVAGGENL